MPAVRLPPNQPREHRHDAIGHDSHTLSVLSGCIAKQCRDLDGRRGFDAFPASDGECAGLIRD